MPYYEQKAFNITATVSKFTESKLITFNYSAMDSGINYIEKVRSGNLTRTFISTLYQD